MNLRLPNFEPGKDCSLMIASALGEKILKKKLYYQDNLRVDNLDRAPGIYTTHIQKEDLCKEVYDWKKKSGENK